MSTQSTRLLRALQRCERSTTQRVATSTSSSTQRLDDVHPPQQSRRDAFTAHRRSFTSSSSCRASQMGRVYKPSGGKSQAMPSMALQMKKMQETAIKSGQVPNDMGLLPDTFVYPSGKNRPSWLTGFFARWRLQRKWMWTRVAEITGVLAYRYFFVRPRPRLRLGTIPGIAQDLHKEMFTHFAEGNFAAIEGKICEGLFGSLKRRIAQRAPNTSLRWTVHKYLSRPKRVSYKAAVMPRAKGAPPSETSGLVQTVVRIHSLQSLQHIKRFNVRDANGKLTVKEVTTDAQGNEIPASELDSVPKDAKESLEYFVIQKSLRNGKEGSWMVWGTTEETRADKIKKPIKGRVLQGLSSA